MLFRSGVRILDLTTVVMGPFAAQLLGDMGADVIKIAAGRFDLDHIGAHVAQQLRRKRAHHDGGEVENADAVEWALRCGGRRAEG